MLCSDWFLLFVFEFWVGSVGVIVLFIGKVGWEVFFFDWMGGGLIGVMVVFVLLVLVLFEIVGVGIVFSLWFLIFFVISLVCKM